jgi:hypothetical protein
MTGQWKDELENKFGLAFDIIDRARMMLPGIADEERREREADRRHWRHRLARLDIEIRDEPSRIRRSYDVHAHRLEPVGLLYLWPASG